jgi:hypothetical protein
MKTIFSSCLIFILLYTAGCVKPATDDGCPSINFKIAISDTTPFIGDNITLQVPKLNQYDLLSYNNPAGSGTTFSHSIDVNNIKFNQRGWYHWNLSNTGCNVSYHDSVYVNVKLRQGTPPCTLTNNFASSSNLIDVAFTSVTQGFDPTFNGMAVYAEKSLGYPSYRVLFNSYNGNTEPIDGIYNTTNVPTFDIFQDYNEVSVSFLYSGQYFHCYPNQKLYVSHVGGKIRVAFCNMIFSNNSILSTCSGQMTKM